METPKKKRGRPKKTIQEESVIQPSSDFSVTLRLGSSVFHGSGSTMLEALKSLPQPQKISTKGIIIVSYGERQRQRPMLIPQIRRLYYPIAQAVVAKQLSFGLK